LERYISTIEITKEVQQMLKLEESLCFKQVCELYCNEDSQVVQLINHKAQILAVGISNMLAMQPVQHVILGGNIIMLGESFLKEVRHVLKQRGLKRYMDRVTISYSHNTDNELSGALWNYLEHHLKIDLMM